MPTKKNIIYDDISLDDFDKKFNSYQTIEERFDFLCFYVLSHGLNGRDEEVSLPKLINHARLAFVESAVRVKAEYEFFNSKKVEDDVIDPYHSANNSKKEELYGKFISDPAKFLKTYVKDIANTVSVSKNNKDFEKINNWKKNVDRLAREFQYDNIMADSIREAEKDEISKKLTKKICDKSMNKDNATLNEVVAANKGGFFENLFGTTSEEYKQLIGALYAFNNTNSVAYGNTFPLARFARAYLHHKIPSFKLNGNDLPKKEDIEKLSGTSRKRVELAVNVLSEVYAQKKIEDYEEAYEELDLYDVEQNDFQKDLFKNVTDNLESFDDFTNDINENEVNINELN